MYCIALYCIALYYIIFTNVLLGNKYIFIVIAIGIVNPAAFQFEYWYGF